MISLKDKPALIAAAFIFICFLPFPGYSQTFESNGYDVGMEWKVKGRFLRLYGAVGGGRPCWKLKVKADMGNRIYNVSADVVTYTGHHNPKLPTMFNAKSDLGRDYKATKGWYVKKLSVYCVGKK